MRKKKFYFPFILSILPFPPLPHFPNRLLGKTAHDISVFPFVSPGRLRTRLSRAATASVTILLEHHLPLFLLRLFPLCRLKRAATGSLPFAFSLFVSLCRLQRAPTGVPNSTTKKGNFVEYSSVNRLGSLAPN